MEFDAILLLSFGGPEGPEQVRPFLENVTRGRNVPPERLDAVAEHYMHFGGVSPINGINRALNDSDQKTADQIREFLKEARTALASGDVDGARTLVAKAQVLLAALTQ